jgi:hypothetical protein
VLTRRPAAEIHAGGENRRARVGGLIQHECGIPLPVVKQERPKSRSLDAFQELLRNDLIRIDVVAAQRRHDPAMRAEWFSRSACAAGGRNGDISP